VSQQTPLAQDFVGHSFPAAHACPMALNGKQVFAGPQ
jgi:hypothetical protein